MSKVFGADFGTGHARSYTCTTSGTTTTATSHRVKPPPMEGQGIMTQPPSQ